MAASTEHVINFRAATDEVAEKARIIARHLNAMADELEQYDRGERKVPAEIREDA